MPTPATPFAGAAPRLSPARVIAMIAISVFILLIEIGRASCRERV